MYSYSRGVKESRVCQSERQRVACLDICFPDKEITKYCLKLLSSSTFPLQEQDFLFILPLLASSGHPQAAAAICRSAAWGTHSQTPRQWQWQTWVNSSQSEIKFSTCPQVETRGAFPWKVNWQSWPQECHVSLRLHRIAELLLGDFVVCCRSSCTFGLRYFVESSPVGFRGQYSQAMRYMIFPPLQRSLWCLHAFAQFWLNSDLLPGPIHCGTTVNAKPGSTIEEELAQSNRPGTWPTLFWLGCVAWQVLGMSQKLSCHERCLGQLKASVLSFRACKSLQPRSTSTYSLSHMFVISLSASSSSVSVSVVWWYQPCQWKLLESHFVHQISPNDFFARSMIEPRPGGRGHYQANILEMVVSLQTHVDNYFEVGWKRTAIYWNYLGW